jgi:hypothetical protein
MISKDDEVMYRDAHDKLTLWLEKWDEFVEIRYIYAPQWYEKTFKKYKKYHDYCSLCNRFGSGSKWSVCSGCPLVVAENKTCFNPIGFFRRAFKEKDKSALIEMIHIIDEAWQKAKGE